MTGDRSARGDRRMRTRLPRVSSAPMFDRDPFLTDLATFVYVARDPSIHVLMSSPTMGSAHAADECLDSASLEAYYRLCYATARMEVD